MFSPFRKSENLYSNFQKIEYLVRILKNKDLVSTVKFVTVLKLFACVLTNNIFIFCKILHNNTPKGQNTVYSNTRQLLRLKGMRIRLNI